MGHTLHAVHALIKAGITKGDGAVVIVKQPVDLLSLFQPGDRSVLPENRSRIAWRTKQGLMPDPERLMAKLRPLFENLPELLLISGMRRQAASARFTVTAPWLKRP